MIKKYLIILLFINSINYNVLAQERDTYCIQYTPIGIIHTGYSPGTGAPRQGILMPETKGTIELYPEYHCALNTLSLFEYIIVLYHFNEVERWEPTVNPPAADHEHNFGLFSTRIPKRPNPIGLSIVKLEKIKNGVLYISGVDAFEGTPVLDIKPYLPSVDCPKSVQNEMIEKILGHHDEDFIDDSTFYK